MVDTGLGESMIPAVPCAEEEKKRDEDIAMTLNQHLVEMTAQL